MIRLLLRRAAAALLLLYLVLTATFFLIHSAPGSPVNIFVGPRTPAYQRERLITLYGLDRPLPEQYGRWLRAVVLEGDWGISFAYGRPVVEVIAETLPATAALGLAALLVEYATALCLGLWAARRAGSPTDHAIRIGALALNSLPSFWLGLMAILLLGYLFPVFPPGGLRSTDVDAMAPVARLLDFVRHLALPATVLGLSTAGGTSRFVRNSLLGVLSQDYVRTARAKGLSERRVLWVHALRNAVVPLTQTLGLTLPVLLNGVLLTEVVFSWPGLGRLGFGAIISRDYPVIIAITALSGTMIVAGNLLADVLLGLADPRVRHAGG